MHEYNVCQTIVDRVVELADGMSPRPRRVIRARLVLGGMRQLVPDNLRHAYEEMAKGTIAEGSALEIVPRPVTAVCRQCGWTGEMGSAGFRCGSCDSTVATMAGGRELYLESIEVEQDYGAADPASGAGTGLQGTHHMNRE
jgi:hydrogenase nickel incorporation protein HypA/HybF